VLEALVQPSCWLVDWLAMTGTGAHAGAGSRGATTMPFALLSYLIGECHYGGRVTDVWDRRALQAVLDMFVSARATEAGFDVEEGSLRGQHDLSSLEAMVVRAHSIPVGAPPEAFGLHSNADIAKRTLVTRGLLDELLTCEPQQPMTLALAQDGQTSDLSVTEVLVDDVRVFVAGHALLWTT
jgi:hypothetical protein